MLLFHAFLLSPQSYCLNSSPAELSVHAGVSQHLGSANTLQSLLKISSKKTKQHMHTSMFKTARLRLQPHHVLTCTIHIRLFGALAVLEYLGPCCLQSSEVYSVVPVVPDLVGAPCLKSSLLGFSGRCDWLGGVLWDPLFSQIVRLSQENFVGRAFTVNWRAALYRLNSSKLLPFESYKPVDCSRKQKPASTVRAGGGTLKQVQH